MTTSMIRKTGDRLSRPAVWFGRFVARLLNWKVEGVFPDVPRAIFVAAPHTSNWDGFYMQVCAWSLGVRLSWITKDSMFKPGIGWFIRWAGGVPVDRSKSSDTVKQIADQFRASEALYLAIAPDGTRSRREYWKSGFYYMAMEAGVPLILGYLDYKRRAGGVGPVFHPSGDIKADMDRIRAFYKDITPCHPKNHGRIRLHIEDELDAQERANFEHPTEEEQTGREAS